MKALIISHKNIGSYVLDRSGCFRFVCGCTSQKIGTEIEIKPCYLSKAIYYILAVPCEACNDSNNQRYQ